MVLTRTALALLVFLPFLRLRQLKPRLALGLMAIGAIQLGFMYLFYYHSFLLLTVPEVLIFTIFTPLYEVLKKRGVEFKFFQRVEELVPGAGDIDSIRITQQVQLKDPAAGYAPLVDVKGLACWPSAPDYAQIEPAQAALLQASGINLESYWSDWPQQYQQAFGRALPETDAAAIVALIAVSRHTWIAMRMVPVDALRN